MTIEFKYPTTSVNDRISELININPVNNGEWPGLHADLEWLRFSLHNNWLPEYPQPYIGLDIDNKLISLTWFARDYRFELEIEILEFNKIGSFYQVFHDQSPEIELALDFDLTNESVWATVVLPNLIDKKHFTNKTKGD